ncbi:MAG: HU family DNA-binding protein [Bdellovibrionales bacterium]|nr:HU family DNA-binding protein [Bdellovibrionales bacterium]
MNKAEFVEKVSKKANTTKQNTENILDAILDVIEISVASGNDVKIVGFGTFDRYLRKPRNARNPKTGKKVHIPQTQVPRFRPGKAFKERVSEIE